MVKDADSDADAPLTSLLKNGKRRRSPGAPSREGGAPQVKRLRVDGSAGDAPLLLPPTSILEELRAPAYVPSDQEQVDPVAGLLYRSYFDMAVLAAAKLKREADVEVSKAEIAAWARRMFLGELRAERVESVEASPIARVLKQISQGGDKAVRERLVKSLATGGAGEQRLDSLQTRTDISQSVVACLRKLRSGEAQRPLKLFLEWILRANKENGLAFLSDLPSVGETSMKDLMLVLEMVANQPGRAQTPAGQLRDVLRARLPREYVEVMNTADSLASSGRGSCATQTGSLTVGTAAGVSATAPLVSEMEPVDAEAISNPVAARNPPNNSAPVYDSEGGLIDSLDISKLPAPGRLRSAPSPPAPNLVHPSRSSLPGSIPRKAPAAASQPGPSAVAVSRPSYANTAAGVAHPTRNGNPRLARLESSWTLAQARAQPSRPLPHAPVPDAARAGSVGVRHDPRGRAGARDPRPTGDHRPDPRDAAGPRGDPRAPRESRDRLGLDVRSQGNAPRGGARADLGPVPQGVPKALRETLPDQRLQPAENAGARSFQLPNPILKLTRYGKQPVGKFKYDPRAAGSGCDILGPRRDPRVPRARSPELKWKPVDTHGRGFMDHASQVYQTWSLESVRHLFADRGDVLDWSDASPASKDWIDQVKARVGQGNLFSLLALHGVLVTRIQEAQAAARGVSYHPPQHVKTVPSNEVLRRAGLSKHI